MIVNHKPYPAYKDSGVEWLGEVPAHWEVRRLRNVIDMRVSNVDKHVKEDEEPVRLCNYVDVYKNDYINEQMNFMQGTATDDEIERFRLEKDDVLITKDSEKWDDIGVPALVTKPAIDLISGYHLALLRPRTDALAGGYLLRALQSKGLAYQFHIEAKGVTRYGLSHAGIKSVWLPLPPLPEQTAIAHFLGHLDRQITRYIRAKEKLIALLKEQKQVIVHAAVTGQIDVRTGKPYPAYKDSGVEWLGRVPTHWEVTMVKHHYTIQLGKMLQNRPNTPDDIAVPYLKALHVQWFRVRTIDLPTMWARPSDLVQFGVSSGDLLVCEGGEGGRCGILKKREDGYIIQNALHRVRPRTHGRNEYLQYVLSAVAATGWFAALNEKATIAHFTREKFGALRVPIPPLPEQTAIARFLEDEDTRVQRTTERTKREIDLLREYRTRLIADVVTGKLDVREAAAKLPATANETDAPPAFDPES